MIKRTLTLAAVAGSILWLAGCTAQTTKAPEGKAAASPPQGRDAGRAEAGDVVTGLMSPTFTPDQQGRILNMGYFMAASALCADLEVDAQKLGRAVEATMALAPAVTPEAQKQQHDSLLMFLGMSSGAMIGSHVEDKAAFCDDAKKLAGGPADSHLFKSGAPSAPSTAPLPAEAPPPGKT